MRGFLSRVFGGSVESSTAPFTAAGEEPAIFPFAPRACGDLSALTALNPSDPSLSGLCPVCGLAARFEGFTDNLRESGICSSCGSFNRQRQLAQVMRRRCGFGAFGKFAIPEAFAIYNTETTGALHGALSASDRYVASEYFGDEFAPGQIIEGRRHESLAGLSFPDASFDLVLSSDVLEHMPDPYVAHAEVFRVLKPGGRHLFTVPFDPGAALDDTRAKLVDGQIVYLAEKQFHGDPVRPGEGILVWTIFGLEMLVRMAAIGFRSTVWNLDEPDYGIVGPYSIVFEALKPSIQPDTSPG